MKRRYLIPLLGAMLLSHCQTTGTAPLLPPVQTLPETPLAPGEIKKVLMTEEDHEYLTALLEPFAESEETISFSLYNGDDLIGTISPAHFSVLAACPYKIYMGEPATEFTDYLIKTTEGPCEKITMSSKPEHGIRLADGITVSAPTFHVFLQTLIRKYHAEKAEEEKKNAEVQP